MSDIGERDRQEYQRKQAALNAARSALEQLGFDAIVVAATYQDESGHSVAITANGGNWYAQDGLIRYMFNARSTEAAIDAHRNAKRMEGDDDN